MSLFPQGLVASSLAEFVWGRLVRETNRRLSARRGPALDRPSAHRRAEWWPSGRSVRTHHRRRGLRPWRRHGRALGGRPRSRPPACLASDRTSTPRQTQQAQPRALSKGSSRPPSTTPVCGAGRFASITEPPYNGLPTPLNDLSSPNPTHQRHPATIQHRPPRMTPTTIIAVL